MVWNLFVVVTLVLLGVFIVVDLVLTTDSIDGNTFSELLREYGSKTSFFPWVLAALVGRWFHPSEALRPLFSSQAVTYVVIVVATAMVVGAGILYKRMHGDGRFIPPWLVVLVAMPFGAFIAPASIATH